jgi:hypothetical protein
MAIQFYHPNRAIKGFASSFSQRDGTVYATIIKQSGWDEKEQNGIFKGNKENPEGRVNVKLSITEVGAILDCIERGRDFSQPHVDEETTKQVSFAIWKGQDGNPKGYSFSVSVKNKSNPDYKNSFYIGFTYAEGRVIREYLIYCLHQAFHAGLRRRPTTEQSAATQPAATEEAAAEPQETVTQPEAEAPKADSPLDF